MIEESEETEPPTSRKRPDLVPLPQQPPDLVQQGQNITGSVMEDINLDSSPKVNRVIFSFFNSRLLVYGMYEFY